MAARLKLVGKIVRITPSTDEVDHLAAKFRRIRWACSWHQQHLWQKLQGVHQTGSIPTNAKTEIEAERRAETLAAEDRAGRLAVDIAGKLLDRLPREARVAAFIDGIATGLAKLPEGTRASLGADGTSVRLTAARAVTPEEVEVCRKALAGVLGHPVLLEVSVEPDLIAGLELEAPHAVVRNSFRADLVRLKSGLVHHDTDAA